MFRIGCFQLGKNYSGFLNSIDVDECATAVDECDQNCQNNVGSYVCSCGLGFILNDNGFHCDGEYSALK